jgi:hypothetical protein
MTSYLASVRSYIETRKHDQSGFDPPPEPKPDAKTAKIEQAVVTPLRMVGVTEKAEQNQGCYTCHTCHTEKTVSGELYHAQRQDKPRTKAEADIAEWRAAINAVRSNLPDIVKLKRESLRFLDAPEAVAAVESGWDAVNLFGVHECNAPKERVGGWGLVLFLAWGAHKCTVEAIETDVCRLRTKSGAIQSQQRRKAEHDHAVPWWQHPGVTGEMGDADHD